MWRLRGRHELRLRHWLGLGQSLRAAGPDKGQQGVGGCALRTEAFQEIRLIGSAEGGGGLAAAGLRGLLVQQAGSCNVAEGQLLLRLLQQRRLFLCGERGGGERRRRRSGWHGRHDSRFLRGRAGGFLARCQAGFWRAAGR
ncbi:hypothetical protein CR165_23840 [Pseudoroseomonas aestuarii]|uniref:Uncharacterized protein n=1 Tax=Teichococcus aestuarii TaxID=568898 RepID=A0A2U1UXC7_9PROT|nr:hypothetical protein CR165_23840 [Pseudoroseomonas aestuarii]